LRNIVPQALGDLRGSFPPEPLEHLLCCRVTWRIAGNGIDDEAAAGSVRAREQLDRSLQHGLKAPRGIRRALQRPKQSVSVGDVIVLNRLGEQRVLRSKCRVNAGGVDAHCRDQIVHRGRFESLSPEGHQRLFQCLRAVKAPRAPSLSHLNPHSVSIDI